MSRNRLKAKMILTKMTKTKSAEKRPSVSKCKTICCQLQDLIPKTLTSQKLARNWTRKFNKLKVCRDLLLLMRSKKPMLDTRGANKERQSVNHK